MSRELEFRGWSESRKRFFTGKDLRLEYYTSDGFEFRLNSPSFKPNGDYDELVLEQYTGLKDKNGVKIFEGDIVKYTYIDECHVFVVAFGKASTARSSGYVSAPYIGFYFEDNNLCEAELESGQSPDFYGDYCIIEVIGNIHENPELLEQ